MIEKIKNYYNEHKNMLDITILVSIIVILIAVIYMDSSAHTSEYSVGKTPDVWRTPDYLDVDATSEPSPEPTMIPEEDKEEEKKEDEYYHAYKPNIKAVGNVGDFDLKFLKLEINNKNMVYSPLSLKYMLNMVRDGADGETKKQIDDLLGNNTSIRKYSNNSHMAFVNVMFIRDTFKSAVNESYINTIKEKYNGSIVYDNFTSAANLNKWVNDNTLGLLDDLITDGQANDLDFIMINALAINMSWYYQIQLNGMGSIPGIYARCVGYTHEDYSCAWVREYEGIPESEFGKMTFSNYSREFEVPVADIGANINNYDIVNEVGEDTMKKKLAEEYKKFVDNDTCHLGDPSKYKSAEEAISEYMYQINLNYKKKDKSTDFYYYDDNEVKVFAKDLREYSETNLLYVGIMPKNKKLNDYVSNLNVESINNIVKNLKDVDKIEDFEQGYIYKIHGKIPFFRFESELSLMDDLKKLGVVDAFDRDKANLTKLLKSGGYLNVAVHKANIEFGNEGIKASAASGGGGAGNTRGCEFEYLYEVPVKDIDLNFNKPYMFIIIDKESGEVWFTGTVYEPYIG